MNSKRILHIEDTWECRRLVSAVLRHHGYEVLEAEDGLEGVTLALEAKPALILMDIHLPGIDGMEATRRIKSVPEMAHVPVIAVTATDMESDYDRVMASGCCGYLPKPFSPSQLIAIVREHSRYAGAGS